VVSVLKANSATCPFFNCTPTTARRCGNPNAKNSSASGAKAALPRPLWPLAATIAFLRLTQKRFLTRIQIGSDLAAGRHDHREVTIE